SVAQPYRHPARATDPRRRGVLMADNSSDYRALFLNDVPMMDARAPVEFSKGAFPGVINLPLMNDIERQKVGTCYKQHGQDAAIQLGHQLVCGQVKDERVNAWVEFARANPDGYLYCFRGGLRSQTVQRWLKDAGVDYPRIIGGYKAMRTFLLDTLHEAVSECEIVVLGGMTGMGKTEVLTQLRNSLDLEGIANHRGSSFGKRATGQPAQIDFENRLAVDLLKKRAAGIEQFVVEDESRLVGSCNVPLELHQAMQGCAMVCLEDSFENRVERILDDYVINLCAEFISVKGESQGFGLFAERLLQSLNNIHKRLGGERHQRLSGLMQAALDEQQRSGKVDLHRGWIEGLLGEYYDPMYAYQREHKAARIEFAGNQMDVLAYLRERSDKR
ncbi:tRNA 2-selenouridine synthase, partial [Pseudomonas savastanoi pv. glycinea]